MAETSFQFNPAFQQRSLIAIAGKKTVVPGSMSEIPSNTPGQLVNYIAPGLD